MVNNTMEKIGSLEGHESHICCKDQKESLDQSQCMLGFLSRPLIGWPTGSPESLGINSRLLAGLKMS